MPLSSSDYEVGKCEVGTFRDCKNEFQFEVTL